MLVVSDGSTFVRTKVDGKSASPLRAGPPLLSNRSVSSFGIAQPLNQCPFTSDLWQAACPASAVALLKGEANLGFYDELHAPMGAA